MPTSVKQMMETANAVVPKITAAEAREMIAKGNTLSLMCAMHVRGLVARNRHRLSWFCRS
jgi:hypothetical protein